MQARIRHVVLACMDAAIAAFAIWMALRLRFEGNIPAIYAEQLGLAVPLFITVRLGALAAFRAYRSLWRYATMREAITAGFAVVAGSLVLFAFDRWMDWILLPRGVYVIEAMLFLIGAGIPRLAVRWRRARLQRGEWGAGSLRGRSDAESGTRVLVIGAGDAGAMLVREAQQQPGLGLRIIGMIDDDESKLRREIGGVPVLGGREHILDIVKRGRVEQIIIAMPSVEPEIVREIVSICANTGVRLRTLPPLEEMISGRVRVQDVRDVRIEDLLRREPVATDLSAISGYLQGRRVLVTGAGGSIGSELCRQVAAFAPKHLVLLEHSENSMFDIEGELRHRFPDVDIETVVGDIRDRTKVDRVLTRFRPHVVYHAAAHKHVPLMEANPDEAVANNVLGTRNVAEAAARCGTERFVMVSTDKAVNPGNVMGATKRMAELVVQTMQANGAAKTAANGRASDVDEIESEGIEAATRFVSVRFGNVLASRGSVIPIFQKQIERGGPVTVTHPEMTRYFMTIPEAVQLILQAAAIGEGGEVFVLDMGEPVRIVDLAKDLIRLSGLEPNKDIDIVYTGVRPGEKLFEELVNDGEIVDDTSHEKIMALKGEPVDERYIHDVVERFERLLEGGVRDADDAAYLVNVLYDAVGADIPSADDGAEATFAVAVAGSDPDGDRTDARTAAIREAAAGAEYS